MPVETIPAPPDTFANPFILCTECQARVTNVRFGSYREEGLPTNLPCEHVAQNANVCPSWGPVNGCECPDGPAMHRRAVADVVV